MEFQCHSEETKIELFWNGIRDHLAALKVVRNTPERREEFAQIYRSLFPNLRAQLIEDEFNLSSTVNYNPSEESSKTILYHHIHGSETDVVLEAPGYLFVGEAKYGGTFHDYGNKVLVHQMIRQYVIASIILKVLKMDTVAIVPFFVGSDDDVEQLKNKGQINFMVKQGWIYRQNILSWGDIERLVRATQPD